MNKEELQMVLEKHALWVKGASGGEGADLRGADLRDAILRGADLRYAILRGADLRYADLRYAILRGADLRDAILRGADLRYADLRYADLRGADLRGANLSPFQIPQEGELIVWKKLSESIAKLRVPPEAKRTVSLVGRKCRAEFVEVLSIEGSDSDVSRHDEETVYKVGEIVKPDSYDDDIRVECTNGIHFFLTKEEAEQ